MKTVTWTVVLLKLAVHHFLMFTMFLNFLVFQIIGVDGSDSTHNART